ncbi:MAG: TIGR03915 family putative DNA repair protein [Bacteroidetes bacterium]|nr:TIGR03915 family putative DNA repair protein [Bacteroidota bacterium]MCL1969135.1 TIGR03915 family putative DNA repair protein [Bacteroidota bacterium]
MNTITSLSFTYDGTIDGIFSCVFEAFDKKQFPQQIFKQEVAMLFTQNYHVVTDEQKANRVIAGLKKRISKSALQMLFICWLSEMEGIEMLLFNYICKSFRSPVSIELNFADSDVLELSKIYKKVTREAERMRQFVRFQKTADEFYFAAINPLYNVLPMVADHFEDRFADQQWVIYDIKRNYALYYNLKKTEMIYIDDIKIDFQTGKLHRDVLSEDELYFQVGWRQYLHSISIKERKNLRQQRQFMPKRFWKYLTEKQN